MSRNKKSKKKQHHFFNKGQTSTSILLLIILVFFMFLFYFLFQTSPTAPISSTTQTQMLLPSIQGENKAGLYTVDITTIPDSDTQKKCKVLTNDVILVIDNSGSMKGSKLEQAKNAATMFVNLIGTNPKSRVSLVVFNRTATLYSPMTNNIGTITNAIDRIPEAQNTCIQCGIVMANAQLASSHNSELDSEIKRSIVLLSDGKANHVDGIPSNNAKQAALSAITTYFAQNNASYYTIAIGADADQNFMTQAATITNGAAFSATSYDMLTNTFGTVAANICNE